MRPFAFSFWGVCTATALAVLQTTIATRPSAGGLVGHWSFDSDFTDSSSNRNHFTPLPFDQSTPLLVPGRYGNAASFDGLNSQLASTAALRGSGSRSFTMGAFVNIRTIAPGTDAAIIGQPSFAGGMTYQSDGRVQGFVNGSTQLVSSPITPSTGIWHHLAETYDERTGVARIFIDGIPFATTPNLTSPTAITSFGIGKLGANTSYLDGLVDEAFLFDEALSDAAIYALAHPSPAPARMWISASDSQPIPATFNSSGVLELDLVRRSGNSPGGSGVLTVWAQPTRDASGFHKTLQNVSFNIVTSAGLVDIRDDIDLLNPHFDLNGDPSSPVARFAVERDSLFHNANNPSLDLTTKASADIGPGNPDAALGIQGHIVSYLPYPGFSRGVGIGPWPLPGDPTSKATPAGAVWKLATFSVQALSQSGDETIHLQIGAGGINNAHERTDAMNIVMAPPGQTGPGVHVYNAGLLANERNVTFPTDLPEIILHVADSIPGDYLADGLINGSDFLAWQRTLGSTTNLAADGNSNHVIDGQDLALWRRNVGRLNPTGVQPGDYRLDGRIDGDDFLVWQRSLGSTTDFAADGDRNGAVDALDLAIWKTRYGQAAPSGNVAFKAIPEPGTFAQISLLLTLSRFAVSPIKRTANRKGPRPVRLRVLAIAASLGLFCTLIAPACGGIYLDAPFSASIDWYDGTHWTDPNTPQLNRAPDVFDDTIVTNQSSAAQRVSIASLDPRNQQPIAAIRQLAVEDESTPVTLAVQTGYSLVTTRGGISVADRGVIELNGGSLEVPASQAVVVSGSGRLVGSGMVTGDVHLGQEPGNSDSVLSPGIDSTSGRFGTVVVNGDLTLGARGVLRFDANDYNNSNSDFIHVNGTVTRDIRLISRQAPPEVSGELLVQCDLRRLQKRLSPRTGALLQNHHKVRRCAWPNPT